METHFGSHPLSMSVLGPSEAIRKLRRDQMAEYFQRRYGPGNARALDLAPARPDARPEQAPHHGPQRARVEILEVDHVELHRRTVMTQRLKFVVRSSRVGFNPHRGSGRVGALGKKHQSE